MPKRGFPITGCLAGLPTTKPDHHLVHILIPNSCQSRRFPQQCRPIPSLFCNHGFIPLPLCLRSINNQGGFAMNPPQPLKAGYTTPRRYPNVGFTPSHSSCPTKAFPTNLGLHERGVICCMPLQFAPSFLTPSTSPRLGVKSQHQELHRCALNGFLAPSSK